MNGISRRGMVGLGLGSVLAPSLLRAQAAPRPVGIAIVGLGKLSLGQLLPAFKNCRSARLAAVVSGDPAKARRVADEHKLPRAAVYSYADFDRIAQDPAIEVVYNVLPNFLHAEYSIRAFRAGKHVLCEKPMATTVADARAMIAAADAANRKLMIAYRCHYDPLNLEGMRLIRGGKLGKPRLVSTNMGRQADLSDPSDAWRLDMGKSGGGALTDMGIYGLNAARYLLNEEPVELSARAQTDRNDPRFRTVEDLITWELRFPSGAVAVGSTSFNQAATMAWEVTGEQVKMTADPGCFYGGNRLTLFGRGAGEQPQVREIDQFAREMNWMADVVRGRAPLVSPGEEGLQDMLLMDAMFASAKRGGRTVRTDWGYKRKYDPAAVVDAS